MNNVKDIRKMTYRNLENWKIGMMMGLTKLSDSIIASFFQSQQYSMIPVKNKKPILHNTK
jgi:hypothetical protein